MSPSIYQQLDVGQLWWDNRGTFFVFLGQQPLGDFRQGVTPFPRFRWEFSQLTCCPSFQTLEMQSCWVGFGSSARVIFHSIPGKLHFWSVLIWLIPICRLKPPPSITWLLFCLRVYGHGHPPAPPSALRKCYAAKLGKNVCWFPLRLEMCEPPKISDYMVKLRGMDHHWWTPPFWATNLQSIRSSFVGFEFWSSFW